MTSASSAAAIRSVPYHGTERSIAVDQVANQKVHSNATMTISAPVIQRSDTTGESMSTGCPVRCRSAAAASASRVSCPGSVRRAALCTSVAAAAVAVVLTASAPRRSPRAARRS